MSGGGERPAASGLPADLPLGKLKVGALLSTEASNSMAARRHRIAHSGDI